MLQVFTSIILALLVISCSNPSKQKIKVSQKSEQYIWKLNSLSPQDRYLSSKRISDIDFNKFKNWDDARQHFTDVVERMKLPITVESPENKKAYKKINKAVNKVLKSYFKLFPHLKSKISSNFVDKFNPLSKKSQIFTMLINDDYPTSYGFVRLDSKGVKAPILALRKVILSNGPEGGVNYPVIAHELTHVLLQGVSDKISLPHQQYYESNKVDYSKVLLEQIKSDSKTQETISNWFEYADWAGEESSSNLGGIYHTHKKNIGGNLGYILNFIVNETPCEAHSNELLDIKNAIAVINSGGFQKLNEELLPADKKLVSMAIKSKQDILKKCLGDEKTSYFEIAKANKKDLMMTESGQEREFSEVKFDKVFVDSFKDKEFAEQILMNFKTKSLYEAFISTVAYARIKMRDLEIRRNFKNIRFYSLEDHADEMAVLVLNELKIDISGLFNSKTYKNSKYKTCNVAPRSEPYTSVTMHDHTPCWKHWRASQLKFDN